MKHFRYITTIASWLFAVYDWYILTLDWTEIYTQAWMRIPSNVLSFDTQTHSFLFICAMKKKPRWIFNYVIPISIVSLCCHLSSSRRRCMYEWNYFQLRQSTIKILFCDWLYHFINQIIFYFLFLSRCSVSHDVQCVSARVCLAFIWWIYRNANYFERQQQKPTCDQENIVFI